MFQLLLRGGGLMIPIIVCSFVSLAIIIERGMLVFRARMDTDVFLSKIREVLYKNKVAEALRICDRSPGPISNVLKAGLERYNRSKSEVVEAIEEAGLYEIPKLEKNLWILSTIAHIAPLMGLLGTVIGMVKTFIRIEEAAGFVNPGDLAGGIYLALITTVAGLIVAIPTLVAYNFFISQVDKFVLDIERSSAHLVDILSTGK